MDDVHFDCPLFCHSGIGEGKSWRGCPESLQGLHLVAMGQSAAIGETYFHLM